MHTGNAWLMGNGENSAGPSGIKEGPPARPLVPSFACVSKINVGRESTSVTIKIAAAWEKDPNVFTLCS